VVTRESAPGLHAVNVTCSGVAEHILTTTPVAGDTPASQFERAARYVADRGGTIVSQTAYGACALAENALRGLAPGRVPVMWVEGDGPPPASVRAVHTVAVSGAEVTPVSLRGRVIGGAWEGAHAVTCCINALTSKDLDRDRGGQMGNVFEDIENALAATGMEMDNLVRTWLYADDILAWYDELNRVRTAFFEARDLFGKCVPASTGIGATNPAGAAVIAGARAVLPKNDGVRVQPADSPLQGAAFDYGSAFSRAMEVADPDSRAITISGTASIDADGNTVHLDDVVKQIALTLDVVAAILRARGMDWHDACRVVAYFRNPADIPRMAPALEQRGIAELPVAVIQGVVCRDDLLFEMELDAVRSERAPA
jgi:enamine deaminase RidA (YjgF/YER057c/UK114 family)